MRSRAVVQRAEVLRPLGVERHLHDGDDDEVRLALAGLLDRLLERSACGLVAVVADDDRLHDWFATGVDMATP